MLIDKFKKSDRLGDGGIQPIGVNGANPKTGIFYHARLALRNYLFGVGLYIWGARLLDLGGWGSGLFRYSSFEFN